MMTSVAKPPDRIVSLLSSATEMLCALGLGDRLVAVSHECDFPPEIAGKRRVTRSRIDPAASSQHIDDQVRQMCQSGQPLYEIDESALSQCQPDLIVTQKQCDVCAVKYEDVVDAVRRMKLPSDPPIVALNPTRLSDVLDDIRALGHATGCVSRADDYVQELRDRIERIEQKTAQLSGADRPRTAIIEWTEPVMLAANWVPEMLYIAGGRCALTRGGQHSDYVDWSDVVAYDPQRIIVSPCGFDLERSLHEARQLARRDAWNDLNAVQQGNVFVVDGNAYLNRSGPRLVEGLELMASLIHPQLFPLPDDSPAAPLWSRFDS